MRPPLTASVIGILTLCCALVSGGALAEPSIVGTYALVSRDLPDGSIHKPPAIAGMLTYTEEYRNFNVRWEEADGTPVSISYIGKYRLTATEYQETPQYWMSNNLGDKGVSYKIPADKDKTVAVTVAGNRIEFPAPGEPPTLVFENDTMTATAKDANGKMIFVDHWKKVR